jgi:hypothetical protein
MLATDHRSTNLGTWIYRMNQTSQAAEEAAGVETLLRLLCWRRKRLKDMLRGRGRLASRLMFDMMFIQFLEMQQRSRGRATETQL